MAIFNAWCDRMPVVVIGATGPVDAAKRRPWIDWIHTARDQGAIVRGYVKWDDQPAPRRRRPPNRCAARRGSPPTAPQAPVYVNLDAEMQEAPLTEPLAPMATARYLPAAPSAPDAGAVAAAAALLRAASAPLLLIGRVSRDLAAWNERVALAEALGARVMTDLQGRRGVSHRPSAARGRGPGVMLGQELAARRSPPPTSS